MKPATAAYIAGLLDGEGCFRIDRFRTARSPIGFQYRPVIEIAMCDEGPLRFIAEQTQRHMQTKSTKTKGNRTVYAQWEDSGPFRTDHWEYVFGNERPKANLNRGAGLDVSPAVRDYLGLQDTDVTDWKFVEFSEVPSGPWAKLGDNNTFVMNQRKTQPQLVKAKGQNSVIFR